MAKPKSHARSKNGNSNAAGKSGPEPYSMPAWMFVLSLLGTLLGVGWFLRQGDVVTAAAIVLIGFPGLIGFKMGFGRVFSSVAALAAAGYFAPSIGMNYEARFAEQFGTSGLTNRFLCIAAVGVLISLVTSLILSALIKSILSKRKTLTALNHFAGYAVGIVEGAAVVLMVLGAALSFQSWFRDVPTGENQYAQWIETVAAKTRESAIGDLVRDNNPFEHYAPLAQTKHLHQTVQALRDGKNVDRLLNDPRVTALRADPNFESAMETLQSDSEIREFLQAGKPLDGEMSLRLMNHPAVLQLVDQEDFVTRVREVAESWRKH